MLSGLENPLHLGVLFLILPLLFGAKRLPEMGRSLGTGMREFKTGILGSKPTRVADTTDRPGASVATGPTHLPEQHVP
jgi:TatA/E family protein of Tat protein translocase